MYIIRGHFGSKPCRRHSTESAARVGTRACLSRWHQRLARGRRPKAPLPRRWTSGSTSWLIAKQQLFGEHSPTQHRLSVLVKSHHPLEQVSWHWRRWRPWRVLLRLVQLPWPLVRSPSQAMLRPPCARCSRPHRLPRGSEVACCESRLEVSDWGLADICPDRVWHGHACVSVAGICSRTVLVRIVESFACRSWKKSTRGYIVAYMYLFMSQSRIAEHMLDLFALGFINKLSGPRWMHAFVFLFGFTHLSSDVRVLWPDLGFELVA